MNDFLSWYNDSDYQTAWADMQKEGDDAIPLSLKPPGSPLGWILYVFMLPINAALMFWFGDTFAPGKATRECNALKVMASIVYLATKGRVNVDADAVSGVLRKGLNSKNANYTVDEPSLKRLKVTTAELRALFEGPSRVDELGFPCGLPLSLLSEGWA